MKKLILVAFILLSLVVSAIADDDPYQAIHDYFKVFSDQQLDELKTILDVEIEYRKQISSSDDETTMRDRICDYFENNGYTIKRVMFQPLVEKDDGLYGGQERWWITFENGEQIAAWVGDDTITYCIGNQWYNDIKLF